MKKSNLDTMLKEIKKEYIEQIVLEAMEEINEPGWSLRIAQKLIAMGKVRKNETNRKSHGKKS